MFNVDYNTGTDKRIIKKKKMTKQKNTWVPIIILFTQIQIIRPFFSNFLMSLVPITNNSKNN